MNIFLKQLNFSAKFFCSRSYSKNTIFSLSSGHGKCGVAVIRVSGPQTLRACQKIAGFTDNNQQMPRYAFLKKFYHPISKQIIDRGLLIWFPGPNSFTGEDSCEFQIHGGLAVISAMLDALNSINGLRPAKPGEFTKRAFYRGKLDLTEVEGLADLIHAETEIQRRQALLQANGSISKLYNDWKVRLLKCIAHIEAYIDFAEDENIEDDILDILLGELKRLENDIKQFLNDGRKGERLRNGVRTVIIGAPNVGKSSFMNLICEKSISIVTNIEGTTRDLIEQPFNISGYPVIFADTAGLRKSSSDIIELEGIQRALNYLKLCDLIILILDAEYIIKNLLTYNGDLQLIKRKYILELGIKSEYFKNDDDNNKLSSLLVIINKSDLITPQQLLNIKNKTDEIFISCKTNDGMALAIDRLTEKLKYLCGEPSTQCPTISHERHRHLLENCLEQIIMFHEKFQQQQQQQTNNQDFAIAAQQLRNALRYLGLIIGEVSTEEILDVIFKDFCIGK